MATTSNCPASWSAPSAAHRPAQRQRAAPTADDRAGALRRALGGYAGPLVLHQGAPAEDRGCETLLRAIADLPGEVRLVLLGDGEPAFVAGLEALAHELGITHRVDWLPSVPLDELLAWTADADVGVALLQDTCANHRLALPNKLFEYVAAGIPVVASDLTEMRRVVERHGVGWTVDATDPAAVSGALQVALSADRKVLAQSLDRAAAALSWAEESVALTRLYEAPRLQRQEGRPKLPRTLTRRLWRLRL
jgi:glycosyltransferase involved in cell wall biosynthesis